MHPSTITDEEVLQDILSYFSEYDSNYFDLSLLILCLSELVIEASQKVLDDFKTVLMDRKANLIDCVLFAVL